MSEDHTVVPIVGIGASAGGIEALEGFFKGLPDKPGIGIVIVTHLNPERESVLHEIIRRYTSLTVNVASDGVEVGENCVYVLPADAVLSISDRRLEIKKPGTTRRERKPIDIFFSALAKDVGEAAVAVVLSGGDGDGTLGVKAVKERGGLTLAQVADGHGPAHPDMPDSAISTGYVDFAVPADAMGKKIVEFARSLNMLESIALTDGRSAADAEGDFEESRKEIYAILRNQVGHDFGGYKSRTFLRRVHRRMQVLQVDTLEAYIERLRQEPKEVTALFRDLLINVTNFFRDADAFDKLAETVIPKLFEGRGAEDTIRVWIPGCATGEEVFSIAMLMREQMDKVTAVPRVQIFATDIDERALSVARAGRYPDALLDSVSPERKERFFIPDGGSYVLGKEVRDLCIFSPHSVIRDPPFSRIDLVSCRNLLIYFGLEMQNQVIPIFYYSLRPEGYLFLGTSENVSQFGDLFSAVEKKHRIFRRRENGAAGVRLPFSLSGVRPALYGTEFASRKAALGGIAFRQTVEFQVLERYAPPHVVTNREGEVIYFSARTGKYVEAATGVPSRQLLTMARKGLRLDLRTALRESVENDRQVVRPHLAVEGDDGRIQMVTLTIEPIADPNVEEALYLILFTDEGPSLSQEDAAHRVQNAGGTEQAEHLEKELRDTRERLQSMIEEYETALEELKSSNEELVSVNEELQSTNEELEASKEELQSLNEELHTVNAELSAKLDALDHANSDLENLFESSQIATAFLDEKLVIRRYTPAVARVFNILPGDRGRPLTDLSSRFPLPDLANDVRQVFSSGDILERRIAVDPDLHFLMRILPYRKVDATIGGVVVTFVEVTTLVKAEEHQQVLIAELNHRVKNMLGIVLAVADQTIRGTGSIDKFREAYIPRLQAMARSYELLSRENWKEGSIKELVHQELAPFGVERVTMQGPDILLKPKQALSVGMILHELATNAGKYGALSVQDGTVTIAWSNVKVKDEYRILLDWRERDGPKIADPKRRGFGLKLLEREAKYTLGGDAEINFVPHGLNVKVNIKSAGGDEPE